MPISSALLDGLKKLADLDESTWGEWEKTMTMFFRGCGATFIADATDTSGVPDEGKALDGELVWTIYSHVHADYKGIIEDEKSGLAAWRKLKARFEKSTRSRRITARTNFYRAEHDPFLPIDVYINKVRAAAKVLKGLKCDPGDIETTDILLMNLHPGAHGNGNGGGSGGNRYNGGGGHGSGGGGGSHQDHSFDDKGYHWCDPTNENHCHRCGRSGHIAARCIHDMPQHIKDWVMNGPRSERANTAIEEAHEVHIFGAYNLDNDEYEQPVYSGNVQVPLRISWTLVWVGVVGYFLLFSFLPCTPHQVGVLE
ncbi:hypothetical protein B0H11DRAFT_664856 [Mycena galericulata]|nr:hypothetical protein B0H11DRAFT_664856 [Mycena galericulata]